MSPTGRWGSTGVELGRGGSACTPLCSPPHPPPWNLVWNQKGMRNVPSSEGSGQQQWSREAGPPHVLRGLGHIRERGAGSGIGQGPWLMLHNDQSCPGIPVPPGSRTGTRPPSAPWQASGSEAPSLSGKCPQHPRSASAPAQCSG